MRSTSRTKPSPITRRTQASPPWGGTRATHTPRPAAPVLEETEHEIAVQPEALTDTDVDAFLDYLRANRNASPHALRAYAAALRGFMDFLKAAAPRGRGR